MRMASNVSFVIIIAALLYVCMYVCMYVCTYVRMYVCMQVCMYVSVYVFMYVCIYVCMYVCMYVRVCVCVCVCVCVYVCIYVKMETLKGKEQIIYCYCRNLHGRYNSMVGKATRLWTRSSRLSSWQGQKYFTSPNCPDQLWGPPSFLFNCYERCEVDQ